ncbi:MAG: hypothetical protein MHM6MM_000159 [Cercozoa sp. M6MM]
MHEQHRQRWAPFLGGVSGMAGTLVSHPLEVVKVRLQLQNELVENTNRQPLLQSIRTFLFSRDVYAGIQTALVRQAVSASTRFGMKAKLEQLFHHDPSQFVPLYKQVPIALTAGACSAVVACPFDSILLRQQGARQGTSLIDAVRNIGGMRGLFANVPANCTRAATVTLGQFVGKDGSKEILLKLGFQNTLKTDALAAIGGGFFVVLVNSPADVVRTRLMNTVKNGAQYRGVTDCIRQIFRHEGCGGFYKGWKIYCVRVMPHVLTMFTTYEFLRRRFGTLTA